VRVFVMLGCCRARVRIEDSLVATAGAQLNGGVKVVFLEVVFKGVVGGFLDLTAVESETHVGLCGVDGGNE